MVHRKYYLFVYKHFDNEYQTKLRRRQNVHMLNLCLRVER